MKSLVNGAVKFSKLWMLALMCVLFLGVGIKAEAAPGQVTGVKQTGYSVNPICVRVEWNTVSGADKYLVEWSDNAAFSGTSTKSIETSQNPMVIENLTAGSTYYVRVSAINQDGTGAASSPIQVVTAPIGKVEGLTQTKAENKKVTLKWNSVEKANAYYIRYGKNTNSLKEDMVTNTSYVISGAADSAYIVYVYPVLKSSSGFEAIGFNGKYIVVSTIPKKITKVRMVESGVGNNPSAGTVKFTWKASNAADGYEYEILGNNGKKILKKTITAEAFSNTSGLVTVNSGKLKNTQFMKIRVRGYVNVGKSKKKGPVSDLIYFAKCPTKIKHAPVNNSDLAAGVKVTWGKMAGANNYTVYVSTNFRSWKKAGTTKGTSYVIKKCNGSALRTGVTYYYKVVANKKVKGKTYTSDKAWYKEFRYVMRYY